MILNVNSDNVRKEVNNLVRTRDRALPFAIRNTLNDAAFTTRREMIKNTKSIFKNRAKTFFSSRSKVNKAKGYNVNEMFSEAGIFAKNNTAKEQPVFNLKEQEEGGKIKIGNVPTNEARISGTLTKIATKNRLKRAKVRGSFKSAKTRKSKAIATAYVSKKTGKMIMNKTSISRVTGIHFASDNKVAFNRQLLYKFKSRDAKIKRKRFLKDATDGAIPYLDEFFKKNIKRQINWKR